MADPPPPGLSRQLSPRGSTSAPDDCDQHSSTPFPQTRRKSSVPSLRSHYEVPLEGPDAAAWNLSQPRYWIHDLSRRPPKWIRQLLGLNPFKTSYWSLFRPLQDFRSKAILTLGILCAIAAGVPLPIIGVIFSEIIDSFPPPEHMLIKSISELLGVAVAYFVVTWIWSVCWGTVGEMVTRGLREALVEKSLSMDMTYYDTEAPDMSSVLTGHTQSVQLGTSEKVGLFIQSISYFVAAFVVGFILNAKLTGILFAAIIPSMVIVVITGTTIVSKLSKKASIFTENATNIAEGCIHSIQVVQAFGAMDVLADAHCQALMRGAHTAVRKSIAGAIMLAFVYFVAYSANALAFYEGSRLTDGGGAGTIYAVVFLILDASFVVGQFGPFIQHFAQAASAGGRIFEVLDHPLSDIDSYSDLGEKCKQGILQYGEITFDDVSFVYPARPTVPVLKNVSLKIKCGTLTGVCGLSGSGKSSLVSLLLRLYDPTNGSIKIDGQTELSTRKICQLNVRDLRSHIALVDQDPVLFTGTLFENIKNGIISSHRLSEDEIFRKCTQAAADANATFISDLSQGIHTPIGGAGGTSLSGGQRQRICLARALVRDPALLILDEPTSALDATSETLILESLRKVAVRGCTIVMIAHRLATLRNADNIIVMGDGKFLEQGTHEELIAQEGPYTTLVRNQDMDGSSKNAVPGPSANSTSDSSTSTIQFEKEAAAKIVSTEDLSDKKDREASVLQLLRRCLAISRQERPFLIFGLCGSLASGGIILGEAIIFGHLVSILNTVKDVTSLHSQTDFFCLMFFVVSLVALVAYSISGSLFGVAGERLVLRVRDISLRNILRQDLAWFAEPGHSPHALMASMNMDSNHLSGISGVIIGTILSVATSVIGGMILAHAIAWKIAIVLLSAVPIMIIAGFLRIRILSKFEERHETAYNEAAAIASEACQHIRTVAAFGLEQDVLKRYRQAIQDPFEKSFRFNVLGNSMLAFSLAITYFVYSLAYYWGSKQVRDGNYTQQQFFIVLPALLFSAQAAGQMFSLAPEVTRARSAARSVFNLHDQRPSIMKDEQPLPGVDRLHKRQHDVWRRPSSPEQDILSETKTVSAATVPPHCSARGSLTLQNISLHYASRPEDPILTDLSIRIPPSSFIGIVGPSGAGKSSLVSLIERFHDPCSGTISIDGTDIRRIPVSSHRARLSLVSQEPDLFPGSIAFNIRLGARPGKHVSVTQRDIEEVCRSCGLHEFISSLPDGYNTQCGNNGSQLSGGQKQRVAVARALIRDPDVLLLDEATASLDSRSEREVQRAVAAARSGRTTVVVAHRLSTIMRADRIFVLDKGRVVEQGVHQELVDKGGVYSGMVRAQQVS